MTEMKQNLSPQSTHFQRLYSGYGIDNPKPSEQFWQSLWEDKPRICIVDIIDSFKIKPKAESTQTVNSSISEEDLDFTNSKKFSLGKWQKNEFFKLNKFNGSMACSRHLAHMKHIESFYKTNRLLKMEKKMKKKTKFFIL